MINNSNNITYNIEEMDLTKLSKIELLVKCEEYGITKYKSKNKGELIELINNKNSIKTPLKKKVEFIIEDDDDDTEEISNKNLIYVVKEDNTTNNVITSAINEIKHLKPLIKWSGGKSDEIKVFEKYFPEHYTRYIEPFIGGGALYFYLNPDNAVISDVHTELIDL